MKQIKKAFETAKNYLFKRKTFAYCFLLAALLVLNHFNLVSKAINKVLLNGMYEKSSEYLDASTEKSLQVFAVLSTYKAIISVIEGSGAGIQIGDLVKSLNDFIDAAWKTVMVSIVSLQMQKLFLSLLARDLFRYFLGTGLVMMLFAYLLRLKFKHAFLSYVYGLSKLLIALSVIAYIAAPMIISLSSAVSENVTKPKLDYSVEAVKLNLNELKSIDYLQFRLDRVAKSIYNTSIKMLDQSAKALFWLITCYILDCFVFPLLFILIFYAVIKSAVSHRGYATKADIKELIDQLKQFKN